MWARSRFVMVELHAIGSQGFRALRHRRTKLAPPMYRPPEDPSQASKRAKSTDTRTQSHGNLVAEPWRLTAIR
jgi:hypothetical protein